eukprot:CAMPEP_0198558240 /NCGR_PEP_ID=MMETSP1462-20131121/90150_1 /TAXON_ID=1333877 /ORGANISM="Brandtodinium nutriculum, Strain RCC3387" /LENGTH=692 /DNA_ID=CAMNT_0044289057 /DNA_START=21 /DNA_END=2099 /DNA_ORIENTATION=+
MTSMRCSMEACQELVHLLCKEHEALSSHIESLTRENVSLRSQRQSTQPFEATSGWNREGATGNGHAPSCRCSSHAMAVPPPQGTRSDEAGEVVGVEQGGVPVPPGDPHMPCSGPSSGVQGVPSTSSSRSQFTSGALMQERFGPAASDAPRRASSVERHASLSSDHGMLGATGMRMASFEESPTEDMVGLFPLMARFGSRYVAFRHSGTAFRRSWRARRAQDFLINPERSAFLEQWDIATLLALSFVAIVAPIQVAMFDAQVDWLFIVNCMVDLLFLGDLVLHFFIMYPIKTNYGYILERSHTKIIKHYLRTWFIIDLISIIPFDLVGLLSESSEMNKLKFVKVVRLMRLLRLVRVMKVSRLFKRFESRMSITYGTFNLIKFFCILFLLTHWLANLWALTLVLVEEDERLPRWIDAIDSLEVNVETKTKNSPAKLYFTCLYFTSYTITSVGYGDIGPKNIVEIIVCTFMIVISGISWAVVLGQVCGTIANLKKEEQAFRSSMDELNNMMHDRVLRPEMKRRLRGFFLSNRLAQRRARHMDVINSLSPGLKGEVVMEVNRVWIQKVNFLREMLCEALYILSRGLVSNKCGIHSAGSVWGVDFVLSDTKLLRPYVCFAMTYVEVMSTKRDKFFELVEKHKECPALKLKVRRFCIWLAFQRALLRLARRKRCEKAKRKREFADQDTLATDYGVAMV